MENLSRISKFGFQKIFLTRVRANDICEAWEPFQALPTYLHIKIGSTERGGKFTFINRVWLTIWQCDLGSMLWFLNYFRWKKLRKDCQYWLKLRASFLKKWTMWPGLPDGFFSNQNKNYWGNFWRSLDCKMLMYCMAIWNILRPFGIFCGHLGYFMTIWYIFPVLVSCNQEKSGNPECDQI
jgi:hypothetical protein